MDAPFFFRCHAAVAVWCAVFAFTLAAIAGPPARGATIRVPADQPTIQAGIDATVDGDTVLVSAGTYAENIDFLTRNITVASHYLVTGDSTFVDSTVIRSALASTPVVTIAGGQPRDTWLCGFTITGATPTNGRGIYSQESSPTIDHNIIRENRAEFTGGGIRIDGGAPAIQHNRIEGNSTENPSSIYGGAGIFVHTGAPEIIDNRIIDNTASRTGGGIYALASTPTIRGNVIGFNKANHAGGGIFFEYCDPLIADNEIFSNRALGYVGGGIFSRNSAPVIERNMIHGNTSAEDGGGIFY